MVSESDDHEFMTADASGFGSLQASMTTSKSAGQTVKLKVSPTPYYVDWGNGSPVECTSSETTAAISGSSIKVYSNQPITELGCENNNITSLNVGNAAALEQLRCSINQLSTLNVSGNAALTRLECTSNELTSLNVSNNTALTTLACSGNQLTSLNLNKNTALSDLRCYGNKLSKLDITHCPALLMFYGNDNMLTSIDLSKNPSLMMVSLNNNILSALDVSKNISLQTLYCSNNKLSSINFGNLSNLQAVGCENNQLASLNMSKCSPGQLLCQNNKLLFSTIKTASAPMYFQCAPQDKMKIQSTVGVERVLDLSSEYEFRGVTTEYKWYLADDISSSALDDEFAVSEAAEVTPASADGGKFTFGEDLLGKTLYCVMTNTEYPYLDQTTTNVKIVPASSGNDSEPAIGSPDSGESSMGIDIAELLMIISAIVIVVVMLSYERKRWLEAK